MLLNMKITIKKLQGGECVLEVLPTTTIADIKKQVSKKLGVPVHEQKLLLLGRMLADDQTVASYPSIKDGTKLYIVVKKPEGFYGACVKYFKKQGMSEADAANKANKLLQVVRKKFNSMSLDDIDKLCMDCLKVDDRGVLRPTIQ